MANGDDYGPPPTLAEMVQRATDHTKRLEATVKEQADTITRLQQENDALKTALRALGASPEPPKK